MKTAARALLCSIVLLMLLAACSGLSPQPFVTATPFVSPTPEPPFVINNESFSASPYCDGKGTVVNAMKDGQLVGTAQENVQAHIIDQSGMPGPWCSGFQHLWQGKSEWEGFTIDSDANDPLVFQVDRKNGYTYIKGKGTVTYPDGKVVTLPLK